MLLLVLVISFILDDLNRTHERAELKEEELKKDLKDKYTKSVHLDEYKKQMQQMEEQFSDLINQLPEDTEVPGLLDDITFTARASGLQVEYIRLQQEVVGEFYIELPIHIMVHGSYHDFGSFVSGTSALSRIVTLHDFLIKSTQQEGKLSMTIVAKTYRYNSEEDKL